MMLHALVTGGSGFVGSHIIDRLLDLGWRVTSLGRYPPLDLSRARLAWVKCDLAGVDQAVFDRIATNAPYDVAFHAAAAMPAQAVHSPYVLFQVNAAATAALAEQWCRLGNGPFIYVSGVTVVGPPPPEGITEESLPSPLTPYAASKLAGEHACRSILPAATILRVSSPYGPRMRRTTVLPALWDRARAGMPVSWHGRGTRGQDFIHIDDVVSACLLAYTRKQFGIFNIASGKTISMVDLASLICRIHGGGAISRPSGQPDPEDGVVWRVDITKAARLLGFTPEVELAEGIRRFSQIDL